MQKRTPVEMLSDFMEGINNMIAASGQMSSAHRLNPKFLAIRDMLNLVRDGAINEMRSGKPK